MEAWSRLNMPLAALRTLAVVVFVIGTCVLVTVAIRREERLRSLTRRAPGRTARLARMLLAVPAPLKADDLYLRPRRAAKSPWYERSTGPDGAGTQIRRLAETLACRTVTGARCGAEGRLG
ncbi:MAG TPA: hypothetical protein VMK13_06430 [Streptosporangiaceae bacterium]|nr:hypothetical protein [Streptosporangiaceae bacterium]